MPRDTLLRRFHFLWVSQDSLVLRQNSQFYFRQKSTERLLTLYILLTRIFNCIFAKCCLYTVVIIDLLLKNQLADFQLTMKQNK